MKKLFTWASLIMFLVVGIYAAVDMAGMDRTYAGEKATVPVYELYQDPESYDDSEADGIAAGIVQQNLSKTRALNNVTAVVFDFRGYDTMGEAFILITAVAGSSVILYSRRKSGKGGEKDEQ